MHMATKQQGLLDEQELAALLRVSVTTIRQWRKNRTGPQYLKIGAMIRYRPEAVEAWLDNRPIRGVRSEEARRA